MLAKKNFTVKILLLIIVIITAILRFYKLGENPPSLSWDEVAQGYNAYSLGMTGHDEFGRFMPLDYLESFGDFKPVLYTYSAVIPIKIWGLNEFSTRFPSAFFGTFTVLFVFFLVREIFSKQSNKNALALLTAFILAVSPWHIQMSRSAFEANLGLFWIVLGLFFFIKGVNDNKKFIVLSAIPFAATFYTFNSTRAFIPFLFTILLILNIKKWKELWFYAFAFIVIFQLALIPIMPHLMSPQVKLRFNEVNIFTDLKPIEVSNARIALDNNNIISKIVHNRRWIFFLEFLRHYLDNLNLRFLFLNGDPNPKFSIQDVGQEYLLHLPFFLLGLLFLIKKYPRESKLIFLWLLTGIIPAATARETPHALRILQTLPMWQIIIAIGLWESFMIINKFKHKIIFSTCYLLLVACSLIYYLHHYYSHYPKEYASEWQYGYKQAVEEINKLYPNYDEIRVTDNLGRPYIYFLFFNKVWQPDFQASSVVERDAFGFVKVKRFDKYVFGGIDNNKDEQGKKILSVITPGEYPKGKNIKKTIYLPNGNPVFIIYDH